jgi:hypothetical protein
LAISSLMSAELNASLVRRREGSLDRVQPDGVAEPTARPAPTNA